MQRAPEYTFRVNPLPALPAVCDPGNGDIVFLTTGSLGIYISIAAGVWSKVYVTGFPLHTDEIVFDRCISPLTAPTPALAGLGAGNVNNGAHQYAATYVTSIGETELGVLSAVVNVVNNLLDGQVELTAVPVSPDRRVTARRIYRTKAGAPGIYFLLATIPNNTATTYLDDTADAALGADPAQARDNTTTAKIFNGTFLSGFLGMNNTGFGFPVFQNLTTGNNNTAVGCVALNATTTGFENVAVGVFALRLLTSGSANVAIGVQAGFNLTTGLQNVLIGENAGAGIVNGNNNTIVGNGAGTVGNGVSNVFLGNFAGYFETGSAKLFIDDRTRASEADARVKALIYGVFHDLTANQRLTFNARVNHLLSEVPIHANNAAATGAGMVAGDIYRNGADPDLLCIVH